ncbi:T7SS effector LXG polymorphic toxin, partial [Priestia megaterium]|uniref:T7SS effector LXG polymorphic toxin n=1 Tax=Priestia megaterium TaxID=1404 RepID=UPI0012B91409
FEPTQHAYITHPLLQHTIPPHLNQTTNTTLSLLHQPNPPIQKLTHLPSLSLLNHQPFLTQLQQPKNKPHKTINHLLRFHQHQT